MLMAMVGLKFFIESITVIVIMTPIIPPDKYNLLMLVSAEKFPFPKRNITIKETTFSYNYNI